MFPSSRWFLRGNQMSKRQKGEERLDDLRQLAMEAGFGMREFSKIHVRVFGHTTVDYWPTTSKAWVVGSQQWAERVTPLQAIEMAKKEAFVVEQDSALQHMQAIAQDDSAPPWEES